MKATHKDISISTVNRRIKDLMPQALILIAVIVQLLLRSGAAHAAVTVLDAWPSTPQLNGTTGNLSGTFAISTGSSRLLIIAVDCQDTGGSTGHTFNATYGGRTLTQAVIENSNRRQTWIGYLTESDIAARSGDTVSVTVTGTHTNVSAHIAAYDGVDQNTPITGTGSLYLNNANPGTFPAAVSVNAGGFGIYTFSSNQARSSDNEAYAEHSDYLNGLQMGVASLPFGSSGTTRPSVTYAANARASHSLVTLNPAPAGSPGTLQFSASDHSVDENGTTITLTVTRTGGSAGVVGVSYATADGTATGGSDYAVTSGTLSWADSDTAGQTITIGITNDTTDEVNETFTVSLSGPTGGATLGAPATGTVTIADDDSPVGGGPQVPAGSALLFTALAGGMAYLASRRKNAKKE